MADSTEQTCVSWIKRFIPVCNGLEAVVGLLSCHFLTKRGQWWANGATRWDTTRPTHLPPATCPLLVKFPLKMRSGNGRPFHITVY
ncbi:MAG: hypothetical protein H6658_13935 [Ardenticatenaceae bacterium]|nr:hypothetical protein [Ardenticatenaceae bacterium]